jgi:hypothetical protein
MHNQPGDKDQASLFHCQLWSMHIPAQRKSAATQAESKPGTPQQPTGQWWHAPCLLGSGDVTEAKMALIYGIASTWPDMGHIMGDCKYHNGSF